MAKNEDRGGATRREHHAEPVVFPVRVAAVDIGSNGIRFAAAEFSTLSTYAILEEERFPVRLGHGVFLTGRLAPAAMDAAIGVLRDVHARLERLGVAHVRAVATSAVREAANGDEFLARLQTSSGLAIEVITGAEEARLVHLAVRSRVPLASDPWLLVDLGGGSVEVSLVDGSGILWSESHTMGSVRLLEELTGAADAPGAFRRLLEEYIATLRIPSAARYRKPIGVIATGGNIEALARLAGHPPDATGTATIETGELRALIETLSRLSFRQRIDELGLREDRADVILPAAMVYERVAELAGASRIVAPGVGVRDGVLLDLVADLTVAGGESDRHAREVLAGALALGRRYMFEEPHATHVAALAVSLFDQLGELHGLASADRRALLAASLLHDVGAYVSYKRHHKHSFYLISESDLAGFSPPEIQVVANVARYHRKGEPAGDHESYAALPKAAQQRVRKLAALLRLADALDREHGQRVQAVRATVGDRVVTLTLAGEGDMLLERWALRRKAALFEGVFERELKVRNERGGG